MSATRGPFCRCKSIKWFKPSKIDGDHITKFSRSKQCHMLEINKMKQRQAERANGISTPWIAVKTKRMQKTRKDITYILYYLFCSLIYY